MGKYPIVPGRGLATKSAIHERINFLENLNISVTNISQTSLTEDQISNNIESLIGAVEIPVGLVGPLYFNDAGQQELVFTLAGTLEGALLASMNRGARVVSMSGGFSAEVIHQKMVRCPLFIFKNISEAFQFKEWINTNFEDIKTITSQYSNHANLISLDPVIAGRSVHVKFVYTTGDAAGQNMTTTCTWHAILWIYKFFLEHTGIEPVNYVIEGNGASDKKVSNYSMSNGRGIHVVAECELEEKYINKVLRTTSQDFVSCFNSSLMIKSIDGMMGYNINVANAIAAIFVATGQDLGSIHESALGLLNVEKTEKGLYFCLHLPCLVIGTVGGGTHLPNQKEALTLMDCYGNGKIVRFAKLIAGFALSLEISTFAAIVGGHFASSHEKLGRNKPVKWLTRSEIDTKFIQNSLAKKFRSSKLNSVEFNNDYFCDNGVLTNIYKSIYNKLTGFYMLDVVWEEDCDIENHPQRIMVKSKPLDADIIKGLHLMASSIDPDLARLIHTYKDVLEYKNCHLKEIKIYELLNDSQISFNPEYYGRVIDEEREAYFLLLEFLQQKKMLIMNSENNPESWTSEQILNTIFLLNNMHTFFCQQDTDEILPEVVIFEPWKAIPLYSKMADIVIQEYDEIHLLGYTSRLKSLVDDISNQPARFRIKKSLIHNDLNSRNIAIDKNHKIYFYDWELAVINYPQRDFVEFISFVLPEDFEEEVFLTYLNYYFSLCEDEYSISELRQTTIYALKEYIVTRVLFYLSGRIVMHFEFAERIFVNSMRMLEILEIQDK